MKIKPLLTMASITLFFLTMPQITQAHRTNLNFFNTADEFAQSAINKASSGPNQSKSPSLPSEKAKMGMYNAVMSALSAGSGLTTKSREHAEKALSLLEAPVTDIEFYARGIAYAQLKNYDLAIANFDKAIALNPQRDISYLSRGLAYYYKENYDRAIIDYNNAIKLEPNVTSTDVEQRKDDFHERYQKASGDIHKLIQADPEPWFYWFRRGVAYDERGKAYVNKGDYDRAIADFTMFIQLNPDHADAYDHRGAAYGEKGDLDQAIADFDRAIQLNPRLQSAYENRDYAYKLKADKVRARTNSDKKDQPSQTETLVSRSPGKANDNNAIPPPSVTTNGELPPARKSAVDQMIEDAKKRGEVVLTRCLEDCEKSEDHITDGVESGRALELPRPVYPAIAVAAHASGEVQVQVLIDTDGTVIAATVVSGHPLLQAAAATAARGARFSPTKHEGKLVKVTGVIRYYFVAK
jgi:TonB family protein